jgi:cardiolipin synthase
VAWLRSLLSFNNYRHLVWRLIKIVIYSTVGFSLTVTALTYALLALQSFVRKRRRFRFPHHPLEPVELEGHRLQIFNYGQRTYQDMLAEIDKAKETILLETFILKGDEVGQHFKRKLIEKAQQGVRVCIAFDGFGSLLMPLGFRRWPPEVQVSVFGPIHSYLNFLQIHTYIRNHRKILVIDGRTAYLGGMNIGREYARTWRDTHLRIDGTTAQEVALAFAGMWNKRNRKGDRRLRLPYHPRYEDSPSIYLHESRPSSVFGPITIRSNYLQAFQNAQKYIKLTTPYFLPDRMMEQELLSALKRGVRVDLIVPKKSNHSIVDILARPIYNRLIEAGAHIWLYQHTVIHSKTATIDGKWSTIGSANLDGRSLINYEINIFIENETFAARMEEMFDDDQSNCCLATTHYFANPSRKQRLLEKMAYPLRSFV